MLTNVRMPVKTNVRTAAWTLVGTVDGRALAKERFLLLIEQLTAELGSERQAAFAAKCDPTYPKKVRESPLRFVGLQQLTKTREALRLRPEFFEDPKLGRAPSYRDFVVGASHRLERDDELRTALKDFVSSIDPDDPRPPTSEEISWLRGLSFRELRLAGMEVTPSLYARVLRERRLQDAGRISRGQTVEVEPTEDTLDLPDSPKRRR